MIREKIGASADADRIHLPGRLPQDEIGAFYAAADVYVLTSREDPFPSVIMEALDAHTPVVAFENAGGFEEVLRGGAGLLAPHGDVAAMAAEVLALLGNAQQRADMGVTGHQRVRDGFSFRRYAFDLAALADPSLQRISVVVPNYNYARYLNQRIDSIAGQTTPLYEIIALDDASTDGSGAVLKGLLANCGIDSELILNTENSGGACRQWLRGVERARGDLIWIAEADDLSNANFVQELAAAFADPDIVMAYCQSKQMDANGVITDDDYLDYVSDLDRERWRQSHVVDGLAELAGPLAVKNTIPNVSACLFRRDALLKALSENIEEISSYRIAGDWATYAHVLAQGKLAFNASAMNLHRRHSASMTLGSFNAGLLREILQMQRTIRQRHAQATQWRARADAYAQELYDQFNLSSKDARHVKHHPEFEAFFR
jgi:hypothetical protein